MKRNMELIRTILLKVETNRKPRTQHSFFAADFPDFDWEEVYEHFTLLEQNGFLQECQQFLDGNSFRSNGITWDGYEFIEDIRNPEIWNKTKDQMVNLGNWSLDTAKALAKAFVKKKIKDLTGLDS